MAKVTSWWDAQQRSMRISATWYNPVPGRTVTSREAAARVAPHVGPIARRVLDVIRAAADGLTDEEIAAQLAALGLNTIRPRRVDLRDAGLIRDSGRTRPTRSGCAATVWVARG